MGNSFPANAFEKYMVSTIKDFNRSIVYVDGEDKRLAESLKVFRKYNKSRVIILGDEKTIVNNLKEQSIDLDDLIEVIEPKKSSNFYEYINIVMDIFKEKKRPIDEEEATEMVSRPNYYAALMLKTGAADGGVSGSLSSTAAMMRPLIQIIGTGHEKRFLSGAAMEIIPDCPYGLNGQFLFADTAVIPEPDEKQLEDLQMNRAISGVDDILSDAVEVDGIQVVAGHYEGLTKDALRKFTDAVKSKLRSGVVVLATSKDGRALLCAGVTADVVDRGVHAGKLISRVAANVGGGGGGRADFAQAGGPDASRIEQALNSVAGMVRENLDEDVG